MNYTMDYSSYPDQLYEAARLYPNICTAYANLRAAHPFIGLHIQAPEIMMQFDGDVDFGKDPKGLLFYHDRKWPTACPSKYMVFYHRSPPESTLSVVARVDFYVLGTDRIWTPFARFLANIKVSQPPPIVLDPGLGQGVWAQFEVVTCHIQASRSTGDRTVNLGSNSIHKQVYFTSQARTGISQSGVLFFPVLKRLRTQPNGHDHCVADYSPDRIVFHIENRPNEVVAVFVPNRGMDDSGQGISRVTWEDISEYES